MLVSAVRRSTADESALVGRYCHARSLSRGLDLDDFRIICAFLAGGWRVGCRAGKFDFSKEG